MTTTGIKVTILGCGSSGGVPRLSNDWGACDPANPKNARTRCSLLVERISETGTTTVVIDTGPDFRQQMLRENVQRVDAVIYTHPHADHLHGIDDLRMFYLFQKERIPVYMDEPTYQRASTAFDYVFVSPEGSSYPPILARHEIIQGETIRIDGAGGVLEFDCFEVVHGDIPSLGIRFNGINYLPDVSDIPESSLKGFEDLDLWIIDCLRRRPHPTHFNLDQALEWIERMQPKQAILTNLHNDLDHEVLGRETASHINVAYDGMSILIAD